jgi:hypothetical protein
MRIVNGMKVRLKRHIVFFVPQMYGFCLLAGDRTVFMCVCEREHTFVNTFLLHLLQS